MKYFRFNLRELLLLVLLISLSITLYLCYARVKELEISRGRAAILEGFLEDEDYLVNWEPNNKGVSLQRPGHIWNKRAMTLDIKNFTYSDYERGRNDKTRESIRQRRLLKFGRSER